MNAIPPDDLSHYGGGYDDGDGARAETVPSEDWEGSAGLEMEPGTEMTWVAPEPLR